MKVKADNIKIIFVAILLIQNYKQINKEIIFESAL